MLEKLMEQLSQELFSGESLSNSDNKCYYLPFENDIEVQAIELEKSYLLKGAIGPPPQQNQESFFLKMMEANLFGIGTRGSALGLQEDEKVLTLSLELDYNSSYKEFKEKLEDFVTAIDFWRNEAINHD